MTSQEYKIIALIINFILILRDVFKIQPRCVPIFNLRPVPELQNRRCPE